MNWNWNSNAGPMLSGSDVNRVFNASRKMPVKMHNSSVEILTLTSVAVDQILHASGAVFDPDNYIDTTSPSLSAWKELKVALKRTKSRYDDSLSTGLGFTLATTVELDYTRGKARSSQQYWSDTSAYWRAIGALDLCLAAAEEAIRSKRRENSSIGEMAHFSHALSLACDGRRLFVTANGAFGVGPRAARPGDDVILLYGATVPCAVRK